MFSKFTSRRTVALVHNNAHRVRTSASVSNPSSFAGAAASSANATTGVPMPLQWKTLDNPYASTGKWILGTAGMVVGMIHVGGITRLTQSGLSMTTWSATGSLPPMTHDEWLAEFERYKQFPEWQQRQSMTLKEFQFIYAWEYGHRMLGRAVGLVFCAPWLYFTMRGKIPKGFQGRMVGLLAMGGTQGLVGWWMVKSGLGDDRRDEKTEIRVKPVRLATHLGMAMATYGALLWTGLDILALRYQKEKLAQLQQSLSKQTLQLSKRLRVASLGVAGLTFATVLSGALVAGQDAGRAYNMWPKMTDEYYIPPKEVLWELQPWTRNLWETTATVQLNHRLLGTATAVTALSVAGIGLLGLPQTVAAAGAVAMTPQVRQGLMALGLAATGQFALGVTTLLHYVPISLAAAHQLGSVVVFTSGIYTAHALRYATARTVTSRTIQSTTTSSAAAAARSMSTATKAAVKKA